MQQPANISLHYNDYEQLNYIFYFIEDEDYLAFPENSNSFFILKKLFNHKFR